MLQPVWLRGFRPRVSRTNMVRLVVIVALFVCALTVGQKIPQTLPVNSSWQLSYSSTIVKADIMYRCSRVLSQIFGSDETPFGDMENWRQMAIGSYERLALRKDAPDESALYRLAVIYARDEYTQQAMNLLTRLAQLDETGVPEYLAVSAVYETGALATQNLTDAVPILQQSTKWPARLVLTDLHRKMGDKVAIEAAKQAEEKADAQFYLRICFWGFCCLLLIICGLISAVTHIIKISKHESVLFESFQAPVKKVRWKVFDAFEVLAVLIFTSIFCAILSRYFNHQYAVTHNSTSSSSFMAAVIYAVNYLLVIGVAFGLIWRRLRKLDHPFAFLGLTTRPTSKMMRESIFDFGIVYVIFGYLVYLSYILETSLPLCLGQIGTQVEQLSNRWPELIIYFFIICIIAPVAEEIIFRGYIFAGLRRQLTGFISIILTTLMFGIAHQSLLSGGMVSVFLIGFFLTATYAKTRSLWPGIIIHALHNILVFLLIVAMTN